MNSKTLSIILLIMTLPLSECRHNEDHAGTKIIFLHHSTGGAIWDGTPTLMSRIVNKVIPEFAYRFYKKGPLPSLFIRYNKDFNKNYSIKEQVFPKNSPYGWNNYPYDYFNIWVKNAGDKPYMEEPTLEMLTKEYNVIIFKHCFPVSKIQSDQDRADINSDYKSVANYKLQYLALREKLHEFPGTKFILFTGAANISSKISASEAERAREFFNWVLTEWDLPDDNIYIWDLYNLQTEGGLYFKDQYAFSDNDPHPNKTFSGYAVELLFNRIIDVIESGGSETTLKGEKKKI